MKLVKNKKTLLFETVLLFFAIIYMSIFSLRRNPAVETGNVGDVYALHHGEDGMSFLKTIRDGPDIKLAGCISARPNTRTLIWYPT